MAKLNCIKSWHYQHEFIVTKTWTITRVTKISYKLWSSGLRCHVVMWQDTMNTSDPAPKSDRQLE